MKDVVKYMKGKDFVKKILEGERDFSRIKLENGFNLTDFEGFRDLQTYLQEADLQKYPIILDYAALMYINASGLYLPYVNGRKINLERANLERAILEGANFWEANLREANFWGANFWEANLREANFWGAILWSADLSGADLSGANFWRANLEGANLRGANLEEANLREAILWGADLSGADLSGAILWRANLEIARKLETVLNLDKANLYGAIVTEKERAIIDNYLK